MSQTRPNARPHRPEAPIAMPLKIALLTYATKPRGSVIHTLELATALTHIGHHICIYALEKDPNGNGFGRPLPCAVNLIPAQPAPANIIDGLIHQRISEFTAALQPTLGQYDIYHAQDCIGANALSQIQATPIVRTIHHIEAFESPYLQQCQDRSIRHPHLCLVVSDRWQQALQTDYGIGATRVVNGVDRQRFSPRPSGEESGIRHRYGLSGPVLLTVGGIEPRKNSLRLLQAFAQVRQKHPAAQLVIVGGATLFDYQAYREQFFAQVKALGVGVGNALVLPGVIPGAELPALYRCADAFVFPSVKEGWGLVVMEAIASGLPVVVSEQAPFTEFLGPQQACFADPLDVGAIAAAIERALNPAIAAAVVRHSQAALTNYTWERSAQQHVQAYRQLLKTPTEECYA
ncbi:MAG: MSMEG_0565 family glycosyltransferase [Cyanobacteria bacterium P01_A01_bin.135]